MPQLLKPTCLEPVLRNKRSHRNEKPTLAATRESPRTVIFKYVPSVLLVKIIFHFRVSKTNDIVDIPGVISLPDCHLGTIYCNILIFLKFPFRFPWG